MIPACNGGFSPFSRPRLDNCSRRGNTCIMTQLRKQLPPTPRHAARRAGPIDSLLDPGLFRALADPTRVRILRCLAKCGRACTVGEIAECCSVDLSVVSRHLSLLERSGVLMAAKEGRTVLYRVRYGPLSRTLRDLADALDECCPPGKDASGSAGCCST